MTVEDQLGQPTGDAAGEPAPLDALGYAQALAELESILAELETDEVDIDRLAERVRRAAALVELCRGRLAGAQLDVARILDEVDGEAGADPAG
jgi:exodeoxyribonuclease VII small subunit